MSVEPAPDPPTRIAAGLRPLTAPPRKAGRERWTRERTTAAKRVLDSHPAGVSDGKGADTRPVAAGRAVALISAFDRHGLVPRDQLRRRTFQQRGRWYWVVSYIEGAAPD